MSDDELDPNHRFQVGDLVCFTKDTDRCETEIQQAREIADYFEIAAIEHGAYRLWLPDPTGPSDLKLSYYLYGQHRFELWTEAEEAHSDRVNHPSHYNQGKYECIEVMYDIGLNNDFSLGNAFKYIWRCGDKNEDPREDIEKAIWYLQYKLARLNEQYEDGE